MMKPRESNHIVTLVWIDHLYMLIYQIKCQMVVCTHKFGKENIASDDFLSLLTVCVWTNIKVCDLDLKKNKNPHNQFTESS